MQLGMIGLGRMGASMVRRLLKSGHQCVACAQRPAAGVDVQKDGATGTASLKELSMRLTKLRVMGLMVPAISEGVPVPVLSAALYARFTSRGNADFSNRVLSAMRRQFGRHVEKPAP